MVSLITFFLQIFIIEYPKLPLLGFLFNLKKPSGLEKKYWFIFQHKTILKNEIQTYQNVLLFISINYAGKNFELDFQNNKDKNCSEVQVMFLPLLKFLQKIWKPLFYVLVTYLLLGE